jgi:profilin
MVDENLVGTGQVSKAAICGQDGSVWAKSGNFNVRQQLLLKLSYFSRVPMNFQLHLERLPILELH